MFCFPCKTVSVTLRHFRTLAETLPTSNSVSELAVGEPEVLQPTGGERTRLMCVWLALVWGPPLVWSALAAAELVPMRSMDVLLMHSGLPAVCSWSEHLPITRKAFKMDARIIACACEYMLVNACRHGCMYRNMHA